MGTYHQVVLRRTRDGEFVARIDPEDYGYPLNFGAGGDFDTAALTSVLTAASAHFSDALEAMWVDDYSGDGWDTDPPDFDRHVPWDGPASLYEKPDLPYLVPIDGGQKSRSHRRRAVQNIRLEENWRPGPITPQPCMTRKSEEAR